MLFGQIILKRLVSIAAVGVLVLLLPVWVQSCSLSRIYSGTSANVWRFTYAISLQVPQIQSSPENDQFLHRCGGTLIARNLVLTAAHCVWLNDVGGEADFREQDTYQGNLSKPLFAAVAPNCRHQEGWERIPVVRYYFPPNYWGVEPTKNGQDIAVLVLERDIREDMFPVIMQINNQQQIIEGDQRVLTIGWGAQNEFETMDQEQYAENMPHLKSADFEVIECDNDTLVSMGRQVDSRDEFDKSMLCAVSVASEVDICPGDSGGPLLLLHPNDPTKDVQIAVSMWAPNLACNGGSKKPSVFTKVVPWMESIQRIIKKENGVEYKSARKDQIEPFMLPDFEKIQMQPVFLPSHLLLQNNQSSIGNQKQETTRTGKNVFSLFGFSDTSDTQVSIIDPPILVPKSEALPNKYEYENDYNFQNDDDNYMQEYYSISDQKTQNTNLKPESVILQHQQKQQRQKNKQENKKKKNNDSEEDDYIQQVETVFDQLGFWQPSLNQQSNFYQTDP